MKWILTDFMTHWPWPFYWLSHMYQLHVASSFTSALSWWFQPHRQILVSWNTIPNRWKNKNVPNHQPDLLDITLSIDVIYTSHLFIWSCSKPPTNVYIYIYAYTIHTISLYYPQQTNQINPRHHTLAALVPVGRSGRSHRPESTVTMGNSRDIHDKFIGKP